MKSVCVGLVLTAAYVLSPALAEVSVSEALRTIDLTSQLVKESVSLTFSNDGADTVKSLVVAAEKEWADRTAFIGATVGTNFGICTGLFPLCMGSLSCSPAPATRLICE